MTVTIQLSDEQAAALQARSSDCRATVLANTTTISTAYPSETSEIGLC